MPTRRAEAGARLLSALGGAMLAALAGCGTYVPGKLNAASGMYETSSEVDKGAVLVNDTSVNPASFGIVALSTSSNIYPGRFEFFARNALADLGVTKVVNAPELLAYAKSHPKLKDLESVRETAALKRVSQVTGPIMIVHFTSLWDGDVRRYVRLRVIDVSKDKVLFSVDHAKMVWSNADSEALYPVLNAFRAWYQASSAGAKI